MLDLANFRVHSYLHQHPHSHPHRTLQPNVVSKEQGATGLSMASGRGNVFICILSQKTARNHWYYNPIVLYFRHILLSSNCTDSGSDTSNIISFIITCEK